MSEHRPQFADEYDNEPPTPVEATGEIGNSCLNEDEIPKNLFPDEHTAEIGNLKVIRASIECPNCGSNVFLHPESVVPHNCVLCNGCGWSPLGYVWFENAQLSDIIDQAHGN